MSVAVLRDINRTTPSTAVSITMIMMTSADVRNSAAENQNGVWGTGVWESLEQSPQILKINM